MGKNFTVWQLLFGSGTTFSIHEIRVFFISFRSFNSVFNYLPQMTSFFIQPHFDINSQITPEMILGSFNN